MCLSVLVDEIEYLGADLNMATAFAQFWQAKIAEYALVFIVASIKPLDETYESWGIKSPFTEPFEVSILGAFEDAEWKKLLATGH